MSLSTRIEIQYSTSDSFLRACKFAFNESRDREFLADTPCPDDWVILAVYDYLKGKTLPVSFLRNPIGLLGKFNVVQKGSEGGHVRVIATSPEGGDVLVS